jgi:hypothetical protein
MTPVVREPLTSAEVVVDLGHRLWGANWPTRMSQFADINLRTLTRILTAAEDGQDYPAARGVIAALKERLAAVLADLEPY